MLFPHYTYRRMILSMLGRFGRSPGAVNQRLVAQNWKTYRQFRSRQFVCNVCGCEGVPFFDFPDLKLRREHCIGTLRETLQCKTCGATMRHRTVAAMLLGVLSQRIGRVLRSIREVDANALEAFRILDTDAFSPISKRLRHLRGYYIGSFHPDLPFDTEIEHSHFNVNLEKMGFESSSFDIVLTSDVMEHVRDIDAAHREISRILKAQGQYIFTVPYDGALAGHRVLVDTSGDEDIFLVPPHYHGDPLTGGILAYRIFGQQIFNDLATLGLATELSNINDSDALIIDGDAFIATRVASSPH